MAWWKFWAKDEDEVEVLDEKGKKVKGGIPKAITLLNSRLIILENKVNELETPADDVVTTSSRKKK